jgi:hypothetical protein
VPQSTHLSLHPRALAGIDTSAVLAIDNFQT